MQKENTTNKGGNFDQPNVISRAPHECWYYFGKCTPYPVQVEKGMLPRMPYKKFNTKEECQAYIDNGKTFDPMTEMLRHGL